MAEAIRAEGTREAMRAMGTEMERWRDETLCGTYGTLRTWERTPTEIGHVIIGPLKHGFVFVLRGMRFFFFS